MHKIKQYTIVHTPCKNMSHVPPVRLDIHKNELKQTLKRLISQNGPLRGIKNILHLMNRDKESSECTTPTDETVLDLMNEAQKFVDLNLERSTDAETKKIAKDLFYAISTTQKKWNKNVDPPVLLKKGNPLAEFQQWMLEDKGANVQHQTHPSILQSLHFMNDVQGICGIEDSLHTGLRCIGSTDESVIISEAQILDKKCIVEHPIYTSRMDCIRKSVVKICGTKVGDEMNAGKNPKQIVKQNGGQHFKNCLHKFHWWNCFFPETTRKKIYDIALCSAEETIKQAVKTIVLTNRYLDLFNFRARDRELEMGYEEGDRETMGAHQLMATQVNFDVKRQLRPSMFLTLKRKKRNSNEWVTTSRLYDPFNTRNCRYMSVVMHDLFKQGIDTNIVTTGMNEEAQGQSRLYGRYHTIKNDKQAMNTLAKKDLRMRAFLMTKGIPKSIAKAQANKRKKIKALNDIGVGPGIKIKKEMVEISRQWLEETWHFPDNYKDIAAVRYVHNMNIELVNEIGNEDPEIAPMVQTQVDGDVNDDQEETLDQIAERLFMEAQIALANREADTENNDAGDEPEAEYGTPTGNEVNEDEF